MKTLLELNTLLEGKTDEGWTGPIAGADVAKHLTKAELRHMVSDEDYMKHVKHNTHIPVFKVQQFSHNVKKVRVGNTEGNHFMEFALRKGGTPASKIVYARDNSGHPDIKWAVAKVHDFVEEEEKERAKKERAKK